MADRLLYVTVVFLHLLVGFSDKDHVIALDNGLALTPPMGWMAWERFRCNIDCNKDPDKCISNSPKSPEKKSEKLIMQMADRLAEDGYRDAGYTYVSIDDCWSNKERDPSGNLQPNSTRFPNGMKALADYLHSRGLKLGMYADYGTHTCAGYPGSINHMEQDAKTFAGWGVDYLKVDGCHSNPSTFDVGYPKFSQALNATGRPILLSCEWPVYQTRRGMKSFAGWGVDYLKVDGCYSNPSTFGVGYPKFSQALNATGRPILLSCEWPDYQTKRGIKPDYPAIAKTCNTWRNYLDLQDSWESVLGIVEHFAQNQDTFIAVAGPGQWNDPDQLVVGDFGLSYEESKAQFALWSILAAPLTMSNDLRSISTEARDILLNREVIAVSQDKLGKMGRRVFNEKGLEVWSRPLTNESIAVVLFNTNTREPVEIRADFKVVGLKSSTAFARDLFAHSDLGKFTKFYSTEVNPSGVVMVKLTPVEDTFH